MADQLDKTQAQIKKFAEDIEANGGVQALLACKSKKPLPRLIYNKNVEFYGPPFSDMRRRMTKRFYRWKKHFKEGTYRQNVLDRYGVTPAESSPSPTTTSTITSPERKRKAAGQPLSSNKRSSKPSSSSGNTTTNERALTATPKSSSLVERSAIVQSSLVGLEGVARLTRSLESEDDFKSNARKQRKMKALEKAERLLIRTIEELPDSEDEGKDLGITI